MSRRMVLAGVGALAVGIALLLSPFASNSPDGLERVAEDSGFIEKGREGEGLMADYQMPGVAGEGRSRALAGGAGTLIALGAGLIAGHLMLRRRAARREGVAE